MICYVEWCRNNVYGECARSELASIEWKTSGEFRNGQRVGFASCTGYEDREGDGNDRDG